MTRATVALILGACVSFSGTTGSEHPVLRPGSMDTGPIIESELADPGAGERPKTVARWDGYLVKKPTPLFDYSRITDNAPIRHQEILEQKYNKIVENIEIPDDPTGDYLGDPNCTGCQVRYDNVPKKVISLYSEFTQTGEIEASKYKVTFTISVGTVARHQYCTSGVFVDCNDATCYTKPFCTIDVIEEYVSGPHANSGVATDNLDPFCKIFIQSTHVNESFVYLVDFPGFDHGPYFLPAYCGNGGTYRVWFSGGGGVNVTFEFVCNDCTPKDN